MDIEDTRSRASPITIISEAVYAGIAETCFHRQPVLRPEQMGIISLAPSLDWSTAKAMNEDEIYQWLWWGMEQVKAQRPSDAIFVSCLTLPCPGCAKSTSEERRVFLLCIWIVLIGFIQQRGYVFFAIHGCRIGKVRFFRDWILLALPAGKFAILAIVLVSVAQAVIVIWIEDILTAIAITCSLPACKRPIQEHRKHQVEVLQLFCRRCADHCGELLVFLVL